MGALTSIFSRLWPSPGTARPGTCVRTGVDVAGTRARKGGCSNGFARLRSSVEDVKLGRMRRDSATVRQLLIETERTLWDGQQRRASGSNTGRRVSLCGSPRLSAIGEAAAINILDPDTHMAVLHCMYALSQVIDGSGTIPEQLTPLFEEAAAQLVGADDAVLFEYDDALQELHREVRAEDVADGESLKTCIRVGEGEVGMVAERVAREELHVVERWSPRPGAHAIAVPMRACGGRGRLVGVVQAERSGPAARSFGAHDEAALRALSDGAAALVRQTIHHREASISRYQAELLLALHAANPKAGGLDQAILAMIVILIKVLSAEKVSIFIADDVRQEFWVRTSETSTMGGVRGVTFAYGKGIVGHVRDTKRVLNLPDAYQSPYFSPTFDRETGYRTRQVLAVPMLDEKGKVIAVIQALNKHAGTDVFTVQDERVLASCCEKISRTMTEKLGRATFRELLHDKNAHTQAFRIIAGTDEAGRHSTQSEEGGPTPPSPVRVLLSEIPELSLSMEAWAMTKDDLTLRCVLMLTEMNLCTYLGVSEEALLHFLHDVQREYLDSTPYHNFQHAFTVTLICFHLLKDSKTHRQALRPLDMFALLLSAVCHDVAHPGVNNAFLVNSAADLALVYNDQSVLEHHHAATMFRLLHGLGKAANGAYDILGKLSPRDCADFRRTCIHTILATDMTKHFTQVDTLHSIAAKLQTRKEALELASSSENLRMSITSTPQTSLDKRLTHFEAQATTEEKDLGKALGEERQQLMECVLHCADIGNPALPFKAAKWWAIRVVDEFKLQTRLEQDKGLPTPPSMLQALDDETACTAIGMQVQFISYFVQPIWAALEKVLPEVHDYNAQITANLEQFKVLHEQLLLERAAAEDAEPLGPAGDAVPGVPDAEGKI